jgi:DMSO/TMAO reductase YedYZ molybdopterin-dependent catalytic subunit
MLIQAGVYAAAAMWMLTASRTARDGTGISRRLFLEYLGLGAAAMVVGTAVLKGLRDLAAGYLASTPTGRVGPFGNLVPELTPSESFYVVSKNLLGDPELDGASWRLEVKGARTRYLSLGELNRLVDLEQYQTLECISNEVGGDLISTALWRGVRLSTLLAAVGVSQMDRFVVFRAGDGYSDSLPLDVAQDESTMVGLTMNGSPLAQRHGFPARLLIPGRYGMKNVKWLTSVQLTNVDIDGYWQQRGWSRAAVAKTMSRFDIPGLGSTHHERPIRLGGVAYAGRRGIARVEVGIRGNWTGAALRPPLSPFTWVIWTLDWDPPGPGRHTLQVRAVDGTGAVQAADPAPPIPTGATGIQQIEVEVA